MFVKKNSFAYILEIAEKQTFLFNEKFYNTGYKSIC